jgi:hypothetical protein
MTSPSKINTISDGTTLNASDTSKHPQEGNLNARKSSFSYDVSDENIERVLESLSQMSANLKKASVSSSGSADNGIVKVLTSTNQCTETSSGVTETISKESDPIVETNRLSIDSQGLGHSDNNMSETLAEEGVHTRTASVSSIRSDSTAHSEATINLTNSLDSESTHPLNLDLSA